MEIKISIPKLGALQKALKQWPELSAREIDDAIKKSIAKITEKTIPITPIDTGRLRGSIKEGTSFAPFKGKIQPTANYAIKIHEGTAKYPLSKKPKNPSTVRQFLKVGAEKSMGEIKNYFIQALKNIAEKTARKI